MTRQSTPVAPDTPSKRLGFVPQRNRYGAARFGSGSGGRQSPSIVFIPARRAPRVTRARRIGHGQVVRGLLSEEQGMLRSCDRCAVGLMLSPGEIKEAGDGRRIDGFDYSQSHLRDDRCSHARRRGLISGKPSRASDSIPSGGIASQKT
ncbi:hypothetical protein SKAU_G00402630 [Synaphobranchus kaupii]|uniref:Uncharacterized protein n=1 Tax=Synaphobranchus kaupii TaxID=118154 RepID=A0A9Q1E9B1_SYNKA|nr:hypothetical protein SKAU_G00402630 [Synaphobranchus kaupii]